MPTRARRDKGAGSEQLRGAKAPQVLAPAPALLRGPVARAMAETYPAFCRRLWRRAGEEGVG
jgi:hypothetical protein